MLSRSRFALTAICLAALVLAGCSSPAAAPSEPAPEPTTSATATPEPEPATPDLKVGDSALGSIVVDSAGLSVYYFDHDIAGSGVSTCGESCLVAWPPVHPVSSNDDPVLDGVTGEVGVITGTDGLPQLTLNGLPLYYWQDDAVPGDVLGQGLSGVWWVVAPDGTKIG